MLSPLSPIPPKVQPDIEFPKSTLNSSKDIPPSFPGVEFCSSHTEDLYLKYTNRDGDKVEIKANNGYEKNALHPHNGEKENDLEEKVVSTLDPAEQAWADVKAWAQKMKDELKQQQLELMKQLVKQNGRLVEADGEKFLLVFQSSPEKIDGSQSNENASPSNEDSPPVPAYWNAENTSNRIVRMAVGFAKVSGLNPSDFAEKIRSAVKQGYDEAHDATGELPGAAGKLYADTKKLTFEKLEKWLEDYEARAYNQSAQPDTNQRTEVHRGTENNK